MHQAPEICTPMISPRSSRHRLFSGVFTLAATALCSFSAAGCGGGGEPGPALYTVKGTVTFDNDPIEKGRIQFRQAEGTGRAYSAEITNGNYELQTEAGKMSVEVTASRIVPGKFSEPASPDEEPEPLGEMYIPAKYNTETTLEVEVKPSGDNEIPIPLTSEG
jgi:hypothetical protein